MEPQTEKGRPLPPEESTEPETMRGRATSPEALFRLFVERANARDLDGLMELYEPDAILILGPGQQVAGQDAIRAALGQMLESRMPLPPVEAQRPTVITGDLALTSATMGQNGVSAEVARQQMDGSWLWVIDNPTFLA